MDTATSSCSVAIADGNRLRTEITQSTGETHARHLMATIDTACRLSGMSVNEMDGFAVTTGPGTFTGLRIGLSTVQGMALAASKPVVGISSLDVLSAQTVSPFHGTGGLVCAMLDARRQEVYYGFYRSNGQIMKPIAAPAVGPPEMLTDVIGEPCLMVGGGAWLYREVLENKLKENIAFAALSANTIRGGTIASLARAKFEDRNTVVNGRLEPLYIRKSDAEVNAAAKTVDI